MRRIGEGGSGDGTQTALFRPDEYAQHLWQVFTLAPSQAQVLPLVRPQLDLLNAQLGEPHEHDHRRLCALTADLFQLSGEIFFDANRYTDAAHCYTLAASADTPLAGSVRCSRREDPGPARVARLARSCGRR